MIMLLEQARLEIERAEAKRMEDGITFWTASVVTNALHRAAVEFKRVGWHVVAVWVDDPQCGTVGVLLEWRGE